MSSAKKFVYTIGAEYEGASEFKKLQADLKSIGQIDSFEKLRASWQKTNQEFAAAKKRLRELRVAMKDSGGKEIEADYKAAAREVKNLGDSLARQKTKLDATRVALKESGVAAGNLSGNLRKLKAASQNQGTLLAAQMKLGVRSIKSVDAEVAGLNRAYKDLKTSGQLTSKELLLAKQKLKAKTAELTASTNVWAGSLGRVKTVALSIAGIGFAGLLGAGYGIKNMVQEVTNGARELENFARISGMSASEFDATAFAVQSVGIQADKLADISKDVKDKIGDFIETGGGEFKDFMENIGNSAGIAAEELIKLSGPDALIAVKKAMDEAGVSAENQVFYLEAIANDASLLIPLLADNGARMKELAQNAKDLGISVSDLDHAELLALADSMKEFGGAVDSIQRDLVVALAPALKEMASYLKENKAEIRDFVIALARGGGAVLEWVMSNRELIASIAKIGGGLLLLSKSISLVTAGYKAMKAAQQLITGSEVVAYGAKVLTLNKNLSLSAVASRGLAASLGTVAAGAGAAWAGFEIGKKIAEWEYMRDVVKANKDALGEVPGKLAQISQATGLPIKSMDELFAAEKKGLVHFDETTNSWVKGAKKMADAVKDSATTQKRATGAALEEMQRKYKEYADEVRRLQDQIAGRERSLAEDLRAMARTGMTDLGAWQDRKKEAEEYEKAARSAADAGNFDEAVALADKAKTAYADLNKEVKAGDQVLVSKGDALKTAMSGVESAGKLSIEVLKKQQQAAHDAMDALTEESGFQDLSKGMDEAEAQWLKNWQNMRGAAIKDIDAVEDRLLKIKDREITVYVNEKVRKKAGGIIGPQLAMAVGGLVAMRNMLSGGFFPGYGGGDRRHVVAEDGEVMIRKESVKAAGLRAALAFNIGDWATVVRELRNRFDLGDSIRRRTGGMINAIPQLAMVPQVMPQALAAGGVVAAMPAQTTTNSAPVYNLNLSFAGQVAPASQQNARETARLVMAELEKLHRGASR